MAQCEKILDGGERCSNQAMPGARFCKSHGRITFRPVERPADTAPRPAAIERPPEPISPSMPAQAPAQSQQATPSSIGQIPSFPSLHVDERDILVAPTARIWLPAASDESAVVRQTREVRLLGLVSQHMSLAGSVRLLRGQRNSDLLVEFTPDGGKDQLSTQYDLVASAARLAEGRVYIGQERAFIQYRDDRAPHGYDLPDIDVAELTAGDENELHLFAHWGSHILELSEFTDLSLADFCQAVAPVPAAPGPLPHQVHVLAPTALSTILASYFRAHLLRYRLARLHGDESGLVLFDVRPRSDAHAGAWVPTFILDHLARMPRVAVLATAHEKGRQRFLCQWQYRYPLALPHVAAAFEKDDWMLLMATPHANLRINPPPTFFDGDQLVDVHTPDTAATTLQPSTEASSQLQLPVLLRTAEGPVPPVAALRLDARETGWLRQLLYRLPGEALADYRICLGQNQEGAVLVGEDRPVEGIPFGQPLRRVGDAPLFIPLRSRFLPNVPLAILEDVLNLQQDRYTVLLSDQRLDLPIRWFSPLSRSLITDPGRQPVAITLRQGVTLPRLVWHAPPPPSISSETPPEFPDQPAVRGDSTPTLAEPPTPITSHAGETLGESMPTNEQDLQAEWRRQAMAHEGVKEFLSAALCYSMGGDQAGSARCYRLAVTGRHNRNSV